MSTTTPIQTFRYVNKPVQEAGVVYRYLDRPSTRLSHGHVAKINKPYHSHQQLLIHDDSENAISSAIMKAAAEFDFLQERLPNTKTITWTKFKRPPPKNKQTTIELRKQQLDRLYRKRAVLSEISCYVMENEDIMKDLFKHLNRNEFGCIDIREIHGFLCATKALNVSPKELKKAMISIEAISPIKTLSMFSKAISKSQLRLLKLDPVASHYKSRQKLRPVTAPRERRNVNTKNSPDNDAIDETILNKAKSLNLTGITNNNNNNISRKSKVTNRSKRSKNSKNGSKLEIEKDPSIVGVWERRAQPFLGKFTKPAMAFAFVYKEKDKLSNDQKNAYNDNSNDTDHHNKAHVSDYVVTEDATPAVFVAKKFSARLKKKALAMRDEKKILGYLEEWMDSKYLRIRDAFMRIDTDGSGELDISEFEDLCISMGLSLSKAELKWVFERIDTDKSGEISFQEFDDHIRLQRKKLAVLRNDKRVGGEKGDRTLYAKRDRDGPTGTVIDFNAPLIGSYRY